MISYQSLLLSTTVLNDTQCLQNSIEVLAVIFWRMGNGTYCYSNCFAHKCNSCSWQPERHNISMYGGLQ